MTLDFSSRYSDICAPTTVPPQVNLISRYLPKRLELSLMTVQAFPKASTRLLTRMIFSCSVRLLAWNKNIQEGRKSIIIFVGDYYCGDHLFVQSEYMNVVFLFMLFKSKVTLPLGVLLFHLSKKERGGKKANWNGNFFSIRLRIMTGTSRSLKKLIRGCGIWSKTLVVFIVLVFNVYPFCSVIYFLCDVFF